MSKVFNHAHIVFGSVSLVQMFEIVAGEISAFITKFSSAFVKDFAGLDLTSNTGNRFIGIYSPATDTFVLFSQISYADATVHSARGYKRSLTQGLHGISLLPICQGRSNGNACCVLQL
jgi:hypothetical protein